MRQRLLDLQAERRELQRTMVKDRLVCMDVEVEPKEQYVSAQKKKFLLFLPPLSMTRSRAKAKAQTREVKQEFVYYH